MKRNLSVLLSIVLLVCMIPLSTALAKPAASATITVEAAETSVALGQEVVFSVYIETEMPFTGIQFDINAPEGMSYIANSGKVPDGLKEMMEFAEASFTEQTKRATFGNDIPYSPTGKLKVLEFKCLASAASVDGFEVSVSDVDVTDSEFESVTNDILSAKVKVVIPVSGFALDKTTATVMTDDGTLTLLPIFTPETATNKNVTWSSSDTSVATVLNGVVTFIKKGIVTITATTEDGGYSASCVITVNCSHKTVHTVPAEDSTCIKKGHAAYTICDDCGEVINGSDAELPLGDHIGGTATCQKKAICSVCHKEYGSFADHNYIEVVKAEYRKTAATCAEKATYYKSCSVCNAKSDETFTAGELDYTNHVGETYLKNQKKATCYEEGYTGDTYCRTCNHEISQGTTIGKSAHNPTSTWETDENSHWKVCQTKDCGQVLDKASHSGGEATCIHEAICSVCGVAYGNKNSSNHKHTEIRNKIVATETETGYTGDTYCTDCNTKISDGETIAKLEHTPILVPAKAATAAEEGNIAYYYCENCGKYYSADADRIEIKKENTVIPKLAPEILEGANITINEGEKVEISFRSNAAFEDFIRVKLDGKELALSKEYTLKKENITVVLTPDFVATLSVGEHTVEIVSVSGTATAKITVNKNASENRPEKSPVTGDSTNIVLCVTILAFALILFGVVAVVAKKRHAKNN